MIGMRCRVPRSSICLKLIGEVWSRNSSDLLLYPCRLSGDVKTKPKHPNSGNDEVAVGRHEQKLILGWPHLITLLPTSLVLSFGTPHRVPVAEGRVYASQLDIHSSPPAISTTYRHSSSITVFQTPYSHFMLRLAIRCPLDAPKWTAPPSCYAAPSVQKRESLQARGTT